MINQKRRVAHYARLENLANILHDKRLKLGSVSGLADPRESSLGWIEEVGYGNDPVTSEWRKAKELKYRVGRDLRILCTAGEKVKALEGSCEVEESIYGRPRMWSQYGDESRGFCVVLSICKLNNAMSVLTDNHEQLIFDTVDYYDWVHCVSGSAAIEYGNEVDLSSVNMFEIINKNRLLHSIYFKKSIDWKGEQEARWLLYSEQDKDVYVSIENAVEAVVLGCEFPLNQLSQVKEYCEALGCPCYMINYQHPKYTLNKVAG